MLELFNKTVWLLYPD